MSNNAGFVQEPEIDTTISIVMGPERVPGIKNVPGIKTQQDINKAAISELPEYDVAKTLAKGDVPSDETEELIGEDLVHDADDGDEDSIGEYFQDDDEPQQDNAYEASSAVDGGGDDSIDADDRWPIRVYKVVDKVGNIQQRCFVNKCAIGHESNYLSNAIANRDRIVGEVAKWLEGNRQKFLCSFNMDDLGGDSDELAFMEAVEVLKDGEDKCPVMQKGLLGRIGEKVGEGGQEYKFSRYLKVLCLRSNDLGKDLDLRILFSREAQFAWSAAAIRGFINRRTQGRMSNEEYLKGILTDSVKAKKDGRTDAWKKMEVDEFVKHVIDEMDVNEFMSLIIGSLKISYKDIEGRIINEKVER